MTLYDFHWDKGKKQKNLKLSFETFQAKYIAMQTNRDESLIIRSIAVMHIFRINSRGHWLHRTLEKSLIGSLKRGIDGTNFEYLRASYLYPP